MSTIWIFIVLVILVLGASFYLLSHPSTHPVVYSRIYPTPTIVSTPSCFPHHESENVWFLCGTPTPAE